MQLWSCAGAGARHEVAKRPKNRRSRSGARANCARKLRGLTTSAGVLVRASSGRATTVQRRVVRVRAASSANHDCGAGEPYVL